MRTQTTSKEINKIITVYIALLMNKPSPKYINKPSDTWMADLANKCDFK